MTCTFHRIPDGGGWAIVCRRGARSRAKPCSVCGREAGLLCDAPVTDRKTCDRPLCHACARSGGAGVDYCPDHDPHRQAIEPYLIFLRVARPVGVPDPRFSAAAVISRSGRRAERTGWVHASEPHAASLGAITWVLALPRGESAAPVRIHVAQSSVAQVWGRDKAGPPGASVLWTRGEEREEMRAARGLAQGLWPEGSRWHP